MRWASWTLGILGVVQFAILAYINRDGDIGYVSTDMAYLVMWLAVGGALLLCAMTCWGDCCCGDGCGCCDDGCGCGDCGHCMPEANGNGHAHEHGEHGHTH